MVSVKSRAHRTLREFANFTSDKEECNKFISLVDKDLYKHTNDLIGVYFNETTQPFFSIAVFERGILFWDPDSGGNDPYRFIAYKEIRNSKTPEYKHTASYIKLTLETEDEVFLPILGGKGKFRDVFEFQRFLIRVLQDSK